MTDVLIALLMAIFLLGTAVGEEHGVQAVGLVFPSVDCQVSRPYPGMTTCWTTQEIIERSICKIDLEKKLDEDEIPKKKINFDRRGETGIEV